MFNHQIFNLKHNKWIRFFMKPYMDFKKCYDEKKYSKSEYSHKIKEFKDKYKGKRCFVIGNGPSLSPQDLNKIIDEKSFAANRIYYIYDKTYWRPTFYVSTDMDIIRQEKDKISSLDQVIKFINYDAKKFFSRDVHNIYIFLKGKFNLKRNRFIQNNVSDDISKYCTNTQTVTCVSMEIAMYMGFTEIYLLGVDHNFSKYIDKNGSLIEDKSINNYFEGMHGGDKQAILYVDDTTACYEVVKDYAKKKGVKIFNATRGGKLDVFERVNFDELFL